MLPLLGAWTAVKVECQLRLETTKASASADRASLLVTEALLAAVSVTAPYFVLKKRGTGT